MFSIKTQIVLWLVAALIAVPLIETLGLSRPRGADKHLSPDELEAAWRNRLRQAFEYLAVIGGTLGALYLMHRSAQLDSDGLVVIIAIILWTFGFIIGLVLFSVVGHFLSGSVRKGYHIALYVLFVFGFVLPLMYDKAQDRAVAEERTSMATQYFETHKNSRLQWRADIDAAGTHGGEGVVPPMLQVLDSGDGVQVTNIGDEPLCLDLRRSHARLGPGYDYQCALWSQRGGLHSCVDFPAGHTEWLRMSSRRPDLPDCSGEPLEFRVGTWQKKSIGWWSDVALEEFDRQSTRIETDPNYHEPSFDPASMRSNEFMREVMDHYESQVVGAPRVAQWRAQVEAAERKRAALSPAAPAEQAAEARHLNLLREAQARLSEVKSLRERLSQGRHSDRQYPDYLDVTDQGDQATVHHPLGAVFYVKLVRAGRDSTTGQEFVCGMRGLGRGTEFGTYVSKSQPGRFALASRTGRCAEPGNSTLEMVVHDFNGRLTFASPGALDRLQSESEDWVQQIEAGRPILPEQASY